MVSRDDPLILIADNRMTPRAQIVSGLMDQGFPTAEAFNGEHCLTRVQSLSPDVVLLNAHMPVTDGFQACRAIRALPQDRGMLVYILADSDDPVLRKEAEEAGADALLVRPLDFNELAARLRGETRRDPPTSNERQQDIAMRPENNIVQIGRWEWDIGDDRFAATPECHQILELASGETIATFEDFIGFVPEIERWTVRSWIGHAISMGAPDYLGHHIEVSDGSLKYVLAHVKPGVDASGTTVTVRGAIQDITRLRNGNASVSHLAHYDALTGLPNRNSFEERLRRELLAVVRRNARAAILFVDIDNFKSINDAFGHTAGDQILKTVAKRLANVIRETDLVGRHQETEEKKIARFGGDEFLLLLSDIGEPQDAGDVARRLVETTRSPVQFENLELTVTLSIGIAICPDSGTDSANLIRNADTAMYDAKSQGKNRYCFFHAGSAAKGAIPAATQRAQGERSLGERPPASEGSAMLTQRPEEGELERLRRENQKITQERDFLIQAANIIAKGANKD